jgi:ParB family chromosome partitioning protein
MSGKIVLGRGLEALIPRTDDSPAKSGNYRTIPIIDITANPLQPRRKFDEAALNELAESFKVQGMLQPVIVQRRDNKYILIAGERRFRAAGLAGMTEIPAIVMSEKDESDMLQMALVENLQREDLNPMEAAEAYRRLMDDAGMTQNQLAARLGKSRAAVANALRLLALPMEIKQLLRDGRLTEGHARAILALEDRDGQLKLADRIINENWSVRTAEQTAQRTKRRRLVPKKRMPAIVEAENYLKQVLGTAVKISHGLKGGRIEVEYYNDEDLDRLLELFKRI